MKKGNQLRKRIGETGTSREIGLHHLKTRQESTDRLRDMEKNKKKDLRERDREGDHHNEIRRDESANGTNYAVVENTQLSVKQNL